MSLQEQLVDELKSAMRERDELRVSTLRMVRADIQNREIETHKTLEDGDVVAVIAKQARQHEESIEAFRAGNRPELAEKEEAELAILRRYLPKQLSVEKVTALASKLIKELEVHGPDGFGKVMGPLMQQVRGQANGETVRDIVTRLLSSQGLK